MKLKNIFDYLHPFLFGLFPLLSLAAYNKKQLEVGYILPYVLIIIVVVCILLFILSFVFKNRRKTAIFLSIFLGVFFSYGHIRFCIEDVRIHKIIGPDHLLVTVNVIIIIMAFIYLKRTRRNLEQLTRILNLVSFCLVIFSVGDIAQHKLSNPYQSSKISIETIEQATQNPSGNGFPDIYYIIPDRYASEEVLKEIYGYDNSEFIGYLRSKGFYVVDNAKSNYHNTAMSLASSLNMRHLIYLQDEFGEEYEDWQPVYDMIKKSEVVQYLKSKGYLYIHMGSWWKTTSRNSNADIDYNITSLSEFGSIFYGLTMLYPICDKLGIGGVFTDPWVIHYQRVLHKFTYMAKIPLMKSPKFIFAHFNFPHPPYIFDKDGNFVPLHKARERERYTDQLTFANKKFVELIEAIIKNSPSPPVIIIQADEGPYPSRYAAELNFNWREASDLELKEKFHILNAIYMPGIEGNLVYSSGTPVNTFRIIFNHYFNENYELLPDRNYAVNSNKPYDFIDVTDTLLK